MKRLFVLLSVLVLAACAGPPHYAYREPLPPPPPPYGTPYQGPQTRPPQQPAPQPHVVHTAMPSYSGGGTAGPLTAKNEGAYMDGLERDLRHYLRGIPVARPGDVVLLNLKSDELFAHGSLDDDGRDLLRNLSSALRHYDHTAVQVNGYTDTRGTPDDNLKTSQKQADAVASALRDDGIAAHRLNATGLGRSHPKIKTGDGASEPRNRRIEIDIVPKPG
jgi:outer membrane protein OmpA-like peptidoglycan-associated protein